MKKIIVKQDRQEYTIFTDEIFWRSNFFNEGLTFRRNGEIVGYFEKVDCWYEVLENSKPEEDNAFSQFSPEK